MGWGGRRRFLCALPTFALLLFAGDDSLARSTRPACGGLPATIVGTSGSDDIVGTSGNDVISMLGGQDYLLNRAGNDVICGGGGKDVIYGGPGNDHIWGGRGFDLLQGGKGDDLLRGGDQHDIITGRGGKDLCVGGAPRIDPDPGVGDLADSLTCETIRSSLITKSITIVGHERERAVSTSPAD